MQASPQRLWLGSIHRERELVRRIRKGTHTKVCVKKNSSDKVRTLERELSSTKKELSEKDEDFDRRIRALRAQHDKVLYSERTERFGRAYGLLGDDQGGPDRAIGGDADSKAETGRSTETAVLQTRVKELESQLDHQKNYYLEKLRKREAAVPASSLVPSSAGSGITASRPRATREDQLRAQLEQSQQIIDDLAAQLQGEKKGNPFSAGVAWSEEGAGGDGARGTSSVRLGESGASPQRGDGEKNGPSSGPSRLFPKGGPSGGGPSPPDEPPPFGTRTSSPATKRSPHNNSGGAQGPTLKLSPGLLRKFLAHPIALVFGSLEAAAVEIDADPSNERRVAAAVSSML